IYVYERVQGGDVIVHHQDEHGNPLHDSISHQGLYGEMYKTKAETIQGWKVKEIQGEADGIFDLESKEVTYVYERAQGGDVTVKHQDGEGNELYKPSKHQGLYGEAYETSEEMITGWKVKEIKGEAQGVYTDKAKEVIYVYERVQGGEVIVHHQDELGNPLHDSISQQGLYGETYKTKAETIQGWKVKEIQGEADGMFDLESKEVTYVYERAQGGDVTVKHQDGEGNELHKPSKYQGLYGEAYETSEEMITGWKVKEIQGEAQGVYSDKAEEVIYVYERVQGGEVIVHHQDELGNPLHASISHQGLYGKTYTTKAETISGWKVKEIKGKIKGTYTLDNQEVTYVYKKVPVDSKKKTPADSNKKATTTAKQKTKKTLPKTGEHGSLLVSLMGLLLVICSISLVVKKKPETK
ncbi:MucBP domain-containing protein, partial [Enterococcus ureasiticus]